MDEGIKGSLLDLERRWGDCGMWMKELRGACWMWMIERRLKR